MRVVRRLLRHQRRPHRRLRQHLRARLLLLWQAIDAHGGLSTWLAQGTLRFEFDYAPIGQPERRMHTISRVDTWRARAVQEEVGEGADARLGWDGTTAWITPNAEAFPSTARFWATTPYYFVGVPFVFADPGTRLTRMADEQLDGALANVVRIEFEAGTGDSPDDYYVLMLDPETHRVRALRYVVAYPGFFPEGGHSPEKLMRFGGLHEVSGLLLAATLHTSSWEVPEGTECAEVTRIDVSNIAFGETYEASVFAAPEGAVITTEIETR